MIKEAITKLKEEMNEDNFFELLFTLAQSEIIIPCNAIFSDEDMEQVKKMLEESKNDPDSIINSTFTTKNVVRMVPDILQNGDDFYFPVFTSEEELGEYGDNFSKVSHSFMTAVSYFKKSEQKLAGIVINAFTDPFVVNDNMIAVIEKINHEIHENA